jgi:hypothetical protein
MIASSHAGPLAFQPSIRAMQADAIGLKRNFRLGMDRLKAAHKNVRFPSDSDRTASRIGSFVPITEVGQGIRSGIPDSPDYGHQVCGEIIRCLRLGNASKRARDAKI